MFQGRRYWLEGGGEEGDRFRKMGIVGGSRTKVGSMTLLAIDWCEPAVGSWVQYDESNTLDSVTLEA